MWRWLNFQFLGVNLTSKFTMRIISLLPHYFLLPSTTSYFRSLPPIFFNYFHILSMWRWLIFHFLGVNLTSKFTMRIISLLPFATFYFLSLLPFFFNYFHILSMWRVRVRVNTGSPECCIWIQVGILLPICRSCEDRFCGHGTKFKIKIWYVWVKLRPI